MALFVVRASHSKHGVFDAAFLYTNKESIVITKTSHHECAATGDLHVWKNAQNRTIGRYIPSPSNV